MIPSFQKAEKRQAKLRLALDGPSGSGKTWTGLVTARAIAGADGRVAVIDTERGSASLYADRFTFDVLELHGSYDPARYIEAIHAAEQGGYDVILVDSLSHAWEAEGGIQEIADRNKKASNSWSGWAAATPAYRSLIEAILQSPVHVIATMRTKVEWGVDERNKPVKIGTAPVMRQGIDYEFTVVGDLDTEHVMRISKSRCPAVADKSYRHPGPEFGFALLEWLQDGEAAVPVVSDEQRGELAASAREANFTEVMFWDLVERHRGQRSTRGMSLAVLAAISEDIENHKTAGVTTPPGEVRSGPAFGGATAESGGAGDAPNPGRVGSDSVPVKGGGSADTPPPLGVDEGAAPTGSEGPVGATPEQRWAYLVEWAANLGLSAARLKTVLRAAALVTGPEGVATDSELQAAMRAVAGAN